MTLNMRRLMGTSKYNHDQYFATAIIWLLKITRHLTWAKDSSLISLLINTNNKFMSFRYQRAMDNDKKAETATDGMNGEAGAIIVF